jgi:uncharacterized protein (TIGR03083 family)
MKRDEVLNALKESRAKMEAALAGLSDEQLAAPGLEGGWSVKDVLSHLTAWEAELVTDLARVKRGQKPGKTQWTNDEINAQNAKWHKENRNRPLDRVLADFQGVRRQSLRQIESLTDKDIAAPRAFLNKQTIADWVREWVTDHEIEHAHHIAEWKKNR